MRADIGKQHKFETLAASPYFADVVAANRAYIRAAILNPERTERDCWILSCLPSGRRLSAVSIRRMETFTLLAPDPSIDAGLVTGFMVVRRSTLERYHESGRVLDEVFPGLEFDASRQYADAGEDQIRVWGSHDELTAALADEYFADAARELADPLLASGTMHWKGHNYQLADQVLGRAEGI